MVNGIPVKNPKSHEKVDAFQRAIRENPILRENFGPNIQEKEGKTKRRSLGIIIIFILQLKSDEKI